MAELEYHPVLGDLPGQVRDNPVARLLYVGTAPSIDDLVRPRNGVRHLVPESLPVPTGLYRFLEEDGWAVLVVRSELAPTTPMTAHWDAEDGHTLVKVYGWFQHWWDSASKIPTPRFAVDSLVVLSNSNEEGIVRRLRFSGGAWRYSVRAGSRTLEVGERDLSIPPVDDDPYEWIRTAPAEARRIAATLTRAKLSRSLNDTLYSFRATRTIFRAYQFKPVMRLLEAERPRLLIADEVGLGKTIEAGLVWTELDARQQAQRVLVVCPSALVAKWQYEMEDRFGYQLTEATGPVLSEFLERLEADRLQSRLRMVCSLERLRTWSGLARAAEIGPRFDLVIVDEAHALRNRGTRSFELAQHLSLWSDAMVFLSATPLNLGNDDLYNLLEVLAPGEFTSRDELEERLQPNRILNRLSATLFDRSFTATDRLALLEELRQLTYGLPLTARSEYRHLRELLSLPQLDPGTIAQSKRLLAAMHALSAVVTRTRKTEVMEDRVVRSPELIDVEWTPEERALYQAIGTWQSRKARDANVPPGFALQMPMRLASSCLPAARDRVLGATGGAREALMLWEEEGSQGAEGFDQLDGVDDDVAKALLATARALGATDTKFDQLLEKLLPIVRQGRRVLIFTFSRPVVAYLHDRLSSHLRVDVLHGGIAKEQRGPLMRRFRDHEFDVLVASRVASEGLDFEFCSAVVNYDLPWNPMEVEQRIGRIDRFGQTEEKVFVFNFHTPGTIESDIVFRVMDRIGVFTDSIGELDPILRPLLPDLKATMLDFTLSEQERERRLAEIETAIANGRADLVEMESAARFLASVDAAEVAGLERDLEASGRYVGSHELVALLEDWVSLAPGATVHHGSDGRTIELNGAAELERHLLEVRGTGERSTDEIEGLARSIRNEQPIVLAIDQEFARKQGLDLLSTTHPLVRASLRVRPDTQARFGAVTIRVARNEDAPPEGFYLTLVSVSDWHGVRPSTELWTTTVTLDGGPAQAPPSVSDTLLGALAAGDLEPCEHPPLTWIEDALSVAQQALGLRCDTEEEQRHLDNAATIELRRTSLRQSHDRKVRQVRNAIETLRATANDRMIALQESQITASERRLDDAMRKLDLSARGALTIEHLAVCIVRVVHD